MNVSLFDDVFNLIVRTLNFDTLLSQSQTKQHLEQAGNRTRTLSKLEFLETGPEKLKT